MPRKMTLHEFARAGGLARAAKLTPEQLSQAGRKAGQARWIVRVVLVVPHEAHGGLCPGPWPHVGEATSITSAIRLARAAGYRVPSRRTPGWCWDLIPAEVAGTYHDAFGVPARAV